MVPDQVWDLAGLADAGINNNIMIFPTNVHVFSELWKQENTHIMIYLTVIRYCDVEYHDLYSRDK